MNMKLIWLRRQRMLRIMDMMTALTLIIIMNNIKATVLFYCDVESAIIDNVSLELELRYWNSTLCTSCSCDQVGESRARTACDWIIIASALRNCDDEDHVDVSSNCRNHTTVIETMITNATKIASVIRITIINMASVACSRLLRFLCHLYGSNKK